MFHSHRVFSAALQPEKSELFLRFALIRSFQNHTSFLLKVFLSLSEVFLPERKFFFSPSFTIFILRKSSKGKKKSSNGGEGSDGKVLTANKSARYGPGWVCFEGKATRSSFLLFQPLEELPTRLGAGITLIQRRVGWKGDGRGWTRVG